MVTNLGPNCPCFGVLEARNLTAIAIQANKGNTEADDLHGLCISSFTWLFTDILFSLKLSIWSPSIDVTLLSAT